MKRIYFDYNATTPIRPEVLVAMMPYLTEEFGNASSIHAYGQNAREAVEQARSSVAALLGARAADVMFTSGGTESNNHAILGVVAAAPGKAKHVITSAIEHVAVLDSCRALAKSGIDLTVLPVDRDGLVDELQGGYRVASFQQRGLEPSTLEGPFTVQQAIRSISIGTPHRPVSIAR